MADPANFTSADLDSILLAYAGGSWSMRDDGAGLQGLLSGRLNSVTIDPVPEPSYNLVTGILIAAAYAVKNTAPGFFN